MGKLRLQAPHRVSSGAGGPDQSRCLPRAPGEELAGFFPASLTAGPRLCGPLGFALVHSMLLGGPHSAPLPLPGDGPAAAGSIWWLLHPAPGDLAAPPGSGDTTHRLCGDSLPLPAHRSPYPGHWVLPLPGQVTLGGRHPASCKTRGETSGRLGAPAG